MGGGVVPALNGSDSQSGIASPCMLSVVSGRGKPQNNTGYLNF